MSVKYLVPEGKHLPYTDESGKPDHRLMGAAWAALHGGYRGNKYEGPGKEEAIKKLRGIYKSEGLTPPGESETKSGDETSDNGAIECRAAVDLNPLATNEILFLPTGLHAITPVSGGIGRPIKVQVTADAAAAIQQQHDALMAKGKRPYFDFNHEDGPASFWPNAYIWRNGEGVIARGEWSQRGRSAVEGKDYRAFSPVFHVDNKRAEAAQVVCKDTAEPNMGGLVNNPAFKDLPLWAKNAGQSGDAGATGDSTQKDKDKMNEEQIAALRAKQTELEEKVAAIKAGQSTDDANAESELRAVQAEIRAEELAAENKRHMEVIRARNKAEAEAAVKAAIVRGAILPKDSKTQSELIARATADPSFLGIIAQMQGSGQQLQRITGQQIQVVAEDAGVIIAAMAKLVSRQAHTRKLEEKAEIGREMNALYAREFSPLTAKDPMRAIAFPCSKWDDAIQAGDVTDTDWGTMAGTLVSQRTLELLKFTFPSLLAFTTDFSDMAATFNQVIMTRTVSIPGVVSYNTSTGWADSTPTTTDVPITISAHRGVQISINENVQAESVRRLFDEIAPAQAYALGKDLVDALYANITDANFTHNKVSTLANMNRNAVIDMAVQLNLQGVPMMPKSRSLLLYSTYFGALQKDTAIVTPATTFWPQGITGPQQNGAQLSIDVANFAVYDAPNLPTNNGNVTGFAGSKSALVIATRVPNDYSSVFPGATGGGIVQLITNPDIGLTVMLVQYVDHKLGKSTQRIALMYGTAAGQGNAGMLLKAATGSGSAQS